MAAHPADDIAKTRATSLSEHCKQFTNIETIAPTNGEISDKLQILIAYRREPLK